MDAVTRHVTLDADAEEAWSLLTEPDDLAGWLGSEVRFEPTPGSSGSVTDHDGTRRRLVVDEVEPGRRISWRWWNDDDGPAGVGSRVEVTVTPTPDGTRVTVVEQPLPGPSGTLAFARAHAMAMGAAEAWSHRLLHLEALLLLAPVAG